MFKKTRSRALIFKEFNSQWYKKWARELKQNDKNRGDFELQSNKFWQNAAICQALYERGLLNKGKIGIGFGVGNERLPALFAKMNVKITASDQDFKTTKAKQWEAAELAKNISSLNLFGICTDQELTKYVDFTSIDMNNIPNSLSGKYDFLWSNCALGHLGSIEKGLRFIENSLECLKPGGWAVHTTELNVLSNTSTLDSGHTVIFRLKDIKDLFLRLHEKGYEAQLLDFNLGSEANDYAITMQPKFGNNFSKIQIGNQLATQVILLIRNPKARTSSKSATTRITKSYTKNLQQAKKYVKNSPNVAGLLKAKELTIDPLSIVPFKKLHKVTIGRNSKKAYSVGFNNNSGINIYSKDGTIAGINPVMLGTFVPSDRKSLFDDSSWFGINKDRPSKQFSYSKGGLVPDEGYIQANRTFYVNFTLNSNSVKPGNYIETFSLVQENIQWLKSSVFQVEITVK